MQHSHIQAAQGVSYFDLRGEPALALTHGYSEYNATILGLDGSVLAKANLGDEEPSALIADVASDGTSLWWTDYRNQKIYKTDFELQQIESIKLPEDTGYIVGITFVPELKSVLLPTRTDPMEFLSIGVDAPFIQTRLPLHSVDAKGSDQYDLKYEDGCVFIVERSEGRILAFDPQAALKGKQKVTIIASELTWPQHLDFSNGNLFIVESRGYQVTELNFNSMVRTIHALPEPRIKRGLTVTPGGAFWLSGFFDPDDSISEKNTGLLRLQMAK